MTKSGLKIVEKTLVLFFMLGGVSAYAVDQVEVQALMPNLIVVLIDGDRTTLRAGEESSHGVKLISSNTSSAILEVDGKRAEYKMGTAVSTQFNKRKEVSEQIFYDRNGMFTTIGAINGQTMKFLIDTGATSVAMSETAARKLGIQYRLEGKLVRTSTASGIAKGWRVNLKKVRLGQLLERNVQGVVLEGDFPRDVLLGMSFLNRMKVEKEGNKMVVTKKK